MTSSFSHSEWRFYEGRKMKGLSWSEYFSDESDTSATDTYLPCRLVSNLALLPFLWLLLCGKRRGKRHQWILIPVEQRSITTMEYTHTPGAQIRFYNCDFTPSMFDVKGIIKGKRYISPYHILFLLISVSSIN